MTHSPVADRVPPALVGRIGNARLARIGDLEALLEAADPNWPDARRLVLDQKGTFALLHHTLVDVARAARTGDAAAARRALSLWECPAEETSALVSTACGPVVVGAYDVGADEPDALADMPVPTVQPDALWPLVQPWTEPLRAAVEAIIAHGFGPYVEVGMAVFVPLVQRAVGEPASSWTTTALPATVYADVYEAPPLFAKEILHESSHAVLNEALVVEGIELPPDEIYWSPWKSLDRPAFGLLHSALAFSVVTNFLGLLSQTSSDAGVRTYAEIRVEQERDRLRLAETTIEAVLTLVEGTQVGRMVRAEVDRAMESVVGPQVER